MSAATDVSLETLQHTLATSVVAQPPSPEPELTRAGTLRDPADERAFQSERFARELSSRMAWSSWSAVAIYVGFGAIDAWVVPDVVGLAWALRYGVVVPVAVVLSILTLTRWAERLRVVIGIGHALIGLFLFLTVGATADPPGGLLYSAYAVLFPLLVPQLTRLGVIASGSVAVLSLVGLVGLDLGFGQRGPAEMVFLLLLFAVGSGYGVWVTLTGEVAARRSYWYEKIVAWQMDQLAIERERSEALLLNVLPESIAARLRNQTGAIADAYEDVTVLFADIVGFTRYSSKVSAAQLVRRLDSIFSAFDELADQHGLEKIKTIGDAYMLAGGLPEAHPDHPRAVARMALAMLDTLDKLFAKDLDGEALAVRIGIHTGPVVAGVIGRRKFIYDLWGDTVNTASRMESHGETGRVHVSTRTAERLVGKFRVERRGTIEVKGKGPMETYWVLGELDASGGAGDAGRP